MKKLKYSAENSPQAWLYLLPALIIILVFHVYPLIKTFIISFEKGTLNNLVFNGLKNYQIVLSDPKFHKAILNTTIYFLFYSYFTPLDSIKQKSLIFKLQNFSSLTFGNGEVFFVVFSIRSVIFVTHKHPFTIFVE